MQGMRQRARRRVEGSDIAGNIERLIFILRIIFAAGVAPAAQGDIQLAEVLVSRPLVEGIHADHRRWLQMSSVARHQDISSVAETAVENQLSARPAALFLLDAKMQ